MFFQNTNISIDQIVDKALNFMVPSQEDTTAEDTVQVMNYLHQHFADPIYGLRSGYVISSLYHSHNPHNGSR